MAVNEQKFNEQQDRVRKLAESYEGPEKQEVADLYVDRIAKLKTSIMDSALTDAQKEDYLKRMDSYLRLVDAGNLQRLKKEYEPLLKSIESTVTPKTKELAEDDREARLDDIADLKIRKELLGEWKEANKFKQKYDSKKEQIELLIKTKKLEPEGTELQYYMTSMEFHSDFLNTKLKEYYDTKDVGAKHEKLKDINEQGATFYEVLTEVEKRLQTVNNQGDLRVIDLNDRNVLAEQAMFVKRKRYEAAKVKLYQQMDDMKIAKNDPIRQQIEVMLQGADQQFETFKEGVLTAQTPEERTVLAEQANQLLDQGNQALEGAQKWLKYVDYKNAAVRGMSLAKILENEKCPAMVEKVFKTVPFFIMPQFAVGLGYYEASKQGMTTEEKVLEGVDFGISLIPFAGGAYDCFAAIRGKTLSGRQMGTVERVVRGVIGVGSIVLDIFTFGVGGTLVKAGSKAALKAGAEITAKATAKAALEGAGKVAVKETAEAGGKLLTKEGAEIGAKAIGEGAAKEVGEMATKEIVEGAAKEAAGKVTVALTDAQKEIIFKGMQKGATAAEQAAARSVLKEVITKSLVSSAKELGEKQAAKLAEQTAKIATRKTTGVAGWAYGKMAGFTGGKFGEAGIKGLESGIVRAGAQKATIDAALKAGKEVGMGYYVQAKFVKEGEVMWGAMAKSVGKESAKAFWHLHNPMEIIRTLQSPFKFASRVLRGVPRNMAMEKAALVDMETSARATLIADGHDAKAVDAIFADVKQKPWQQVLKENENNPILKDPDVRTFFESFQMQFPKSALTQVGAVSGLYKSFKELEPDAITSAKMTYDSRRMEWKDFAEKYKDNLRAATPEQLKLMEEQFKNLHSLNMELPVNVAKYKEGKADVKLTEDQVKKLRGELEALEKEKTEIESMMKEYQETLAAKEKGGKALSAQEKEELWLGMYKKLEDGPLKKAIQAKRDALLKDMGIEVKAEVDELKAAEFSEFKKYTAHAMEGQIEFRLTDVEKRWLAKMDEVGTAQIEFEIKKGTGKMGPQKLEQKGDTVALGEKRTQEALDVMALDATRKSIKKFEQDIKVSSVESKKVNDFLTEFEKARQAKEVSVAQKLTPQQELEVWYDMYAKMPAGPVKKAIDDMRIKNSSLMAKEGTDLWKQEMGNITKQQTLKHRDDLEKSLRTTKDDLRKIDPNNPAAKPDAIITPPPPSVSQFQPQAPSNTVTLQNPQPGPNAGPAAVPSPLQAIPPLPPIPKLSPNAKKPKAAPGIVPTSRFADRDLWETTMYMKDGQSTVAGVKDLSTQRYYRFDHGEKMEWKLINSRGDKAGYVVLKDGTEVELEAWIRNYDKKAAA